MEQRDYSNLLPIRPPEQIYSWLESQGRLSGNALVYRVAYVKNPLTDIKEKMVQVTCTACGETFYQQYIKDNGCAMFPAEFGFINSETNEAVGSRITTTCPTCGAGTKAYHIGDLRYPATMSQVWPITIHEIDGHLALICWYIKETVSKEAQKEIVTEPYEAYVFDGKKAIKLKGYRKFMSSMSFLGCWEQMKKCTDSIGVQDTALIMPFDSKILERTDAANCKLDQYITGSQTCFPVTYMRLWQKHKNVENLVVQGAIKILNSYIDGNAYCSGYYGQMKYGTTRINGIKWKARRPAQMLGLDKVEFQKALYNKWDSKDLEMYKLAKTTGEILSAEDMRLCKIHGYRYCKEILDRNLKVMKTLKYVEKQKKKYKHKFIDVKYLLDYWNMAKKMGDDLSDQSVVYPQNLKNAHDTAVTRQDYKQQEKLKPMFAKRYDELKKFEYQQNGLIITPAKCQKEIIDEGKTLNHCVGGYAQSHANGKTAIFFIRKITEPSAPFYTLEFDEKNCRVLQNRGYKNCARTDEVIEFEKQWLKFAKEIFQNGKTDHRYTKQVA